MSRLSSFFRSLFGGGTPPAAPSPAYRRLLSENAGVALERQRFLADLIGDRPWEYDVDTGRLTFGDDLVYRAEILGSEAVGPGTWLWSWANAESSFPPAITKVASRLRARGARDGIAELSDPEVPLDRVSGHELAMIAVGLGEGFAYYSGPHDGGAVLLLITDDRYPALPEPEGARWMTLLSQLTMVAELDQRVAYESLFRARGFEVSSDGDTLRARRDGVGEVALSFDALGRMTQLDGAIP